MKTIFLILLVIHTIIWTIIGIQKYHGKNLRIENIIPEKLPTLTIPQIAASANFLAKCTYFGIVWPQQKQKLLNGALFHVIVPPLSPPNICGVFVPGGDSDSNYIFLYPQSWTNKGCYGASPMMVLSHEMLHQLGLPPHFIENGTEEYYKNDPIEITMTRCMAEAVHVKEPIRWEDVK